MEGSALTLTPRAALDQVTATVGGVATRKKSALAASIHQHLLAVEDDPVAVSLGFIS
jgi:hypothetical protein